MLVFFPTRRAFRSARVLPNLTVSQVERALPKRAKLRSVSALCDCTVLQFALADLGSALREASLEAVRTANFSRFVHAKLEMMPIFESLEPQVMESLCPLWELEDHGCTHTRI